MMDRKLNFDNDVLNNVTKSFNILSETINEVSFDIWTEIPENFKDSYYQNERIINPNNESFEVWEAKLSKRPNPVYSVALSGNRVISSVCGGEVYTERIMNLWATNPEYRQRGIGKIVLLNFIKYCFEENPNMIRALNVTSQGVDIVLTEIGFV